jgi:GR25 family glycosyltransferase involved in LPS biosynthesis
VDIRVINLPRRPDRWERFEKAAKDIGLPAYRRFDAVDGRTLQLTADIERLFEVKRPAMFAGKRVPGHHNFNAAVIGCALSHYRLWRELAGDPAKADADCVIVVEDDAEFDPEFAPKWTRIYETIRADEMWDLIYLGFNDDQGHLYGDVPAHEHVHRFNGTPPTPRRHGGGSFGYCVRKRAAAILVALADAFKIQQPIDHWLIDQFDALCVYKTVPYLIWADNRGANPAADSDIQHTTRVLKAI